MRAGQEEFCFCKLCGVSRIPVVITLHSGAVGQSSNVDSYCVPQKNIHVADATGPFEADDIEYAMAEDKP
jgi:hypothetical protein